MARSRRFKEPWKKRVVALVEEFEDLYERVMDRSEEYELDRMDFKYLRDAKRELTEFTGDLQDALRRMFNEDVMETLPGVRDRVFDLEDEIRRFRMVSMKQRVRVSDREYVDAAEDVLEAFDHLLAY